MINNSSSTKTGPVIQSGAKTPPSASQSPTKQASQHLLQRSGSARLTRVNSSVDKNKREVQTRTTNSSGSQPAANSQSHQPTATDAVPDVVNANAPPASRVPPTDTTGSGSTHVPALSKPKTTARSSPKAASRLQPNVSRTAPSSAPASAPAEEPAGVRHSKEQVEKQNQAIASLKRLLQQGNRRAEALAVVIQQVFTEREVTLKQKKELAQELSSLRDELVSTSQCCDQLQREKEEVRLGLEEALGKLQQQHAEELERLEDRLRSFYQSEWDKAQQMYQEEADKYREMMEKQVEELRSRQEAERTKQDETHSHNMETLKQQHETAVQEMKTTQQTELENLEKTLKETEASLSEKISELTSEKDALSEKLDAEEERRKRILNDKSLKDSHTLYLEQELESLKVVLEIKNNQLHQKEKKLMEMDKLMESNIKLEECLTKVQQENEDFKARMDRHAALSKQLSTEQAILQQTLQKESKVNKRLSMENEELLWKLHNGDLLASPRRLSPTSPFSSPRNSAAFTTAAPLSPR